LNDRDVIIEKEITMNAIELLKEDHDRVSALFEKVKANEDGDNSDVFKQIKEELDVHTHIEETIFYPRLIEEGDEELQKIVKEGIEEHRQAKMFLRELESLADDSEKFQPKIKVLMEDVEHHVQEEEGEMFHLVESQFDEDVLEAMGAEMEEEKANFEPQSSSASAR
jgi:hemerythrin superfamily protein